MTRRIVCLLALIGLLAVGVLGAQGNAAASDAVGAMKTKLTKVKFQGPLTQAFDHWQKVSGARLLVDWPALEAVGVKPGAKVSLDIPEASAAGVLDVVLYQAAPAEHPLAWWADESAVRVSTQEYVLYRNKLRSVADTAMRQAVTSLPAPAGPKSDSFRPPKQFKFDNMSLESFIQFFRDVSGINVHVQWAALEKVGIARNTAITLDVSDVSLGKALDLVLDQINADKTKFDRVYWIVDDGVLTVSTGQSLNVSLESKVIDVTDLLVLVPDFEPPAVNFSSGTTIGGVNVSGGVAGSLISTPNAPVAGPSRAELRKRAEENLIAIVKESIGDDMWQPNGKGSIRIHNGQMIISQTPLGYKLLEGLSLPR